MARRRWIAPWKNSTVKPVFYHCISRVVDRRFAFKGDDKEKFRMFMRMYENFTGCRVVSYCLMCNHIHLLLEVPPMPGQGFSDEELHKRLSALYNEAVVGEVAKELAQARELGTEGAVREIHDRFTRRMHDLSRFMEGLLQRFTRWYNRTHERSGNLWEDAFKSVIVEDGAAAKTVAAYIDLNPVRAGMVLDPADYRWSSYGEAIGGGAKGNGRKARAGLVRALLAHAGVDADAGLWSGGVSQEYRKMLMSGAAATTEDRIGRDGKTVLRTVRKGMAKERAERERGTGGEISFGKMLRCRVRYFTEGAVIGSRGFVEEAFMKCRERFGPKRTTGARKLKGAAAPADGILWSMRDLRKGVK
jgi:REP element-mobilizing transposase RayT